jgi:hypothetical protein
MREKIAKLVWPAMLWTSKQGGNGSGPAWVDGGSSFAQDEARRAADAIIDAMPDMIASLVWEEGIAVCPVTKDRYSADWYDAGDDCTALLINGTYHCGDMSMTELKSAANTHRRAAIMAPFTGETA